MARILVVDGHSSAGLSITRSAGHAGHWVAVGANQGIFSAAQLSRYCSQRFSYPVPAENATAFVGSIFDFARSQKIDLIIPVTDWTIGPLSVHRDRFVHVCRVALPPAHAMEMAADKYQTIQMAEALGIAVPRTYFIASRDDIARVENVTFPAVVKDRISVRWLGDKARFGSVAYAYSQAELRNMILERVASAGDVLVQEFVSGKGIGFSCFVAQGKSFLPFQWERVREVDPRGSASCARKSIPLDDRLVEMSTRLINAIGFEGIAMVEYKRTLEGKMVLMEINGRPWGSLGLPVACGIDYPKYLIDWCLNDSLPPENISYKPDFLCRRIVGELTHLNNLRAGKPANWASPYPGFWETLVQMAVPTPANLHFDDLWLSDPRPGIAGIAHLFQRAIRGR